LIFLFKLHFISIHIKRNCLDHCYTFVVENKLFKIAEWIVKEQGQDCRRKNNPNNLIGVDLKTMKKQYLTEIKSAVNIYQRFDNAKMARASHLADVEVENCKLNEINSVGEFRGDLKAFPLKEFHVKVCEKRKVNVAINFGVNFFLLLYPSCDVKMVHAKKKHQGIGAIEE
jgi:hypothetical protein